MATHSVIVLIPTEIELLWVGLVGKGNPFGNMQIRLLRFNIFIVIARWQLLIAALYSSKEHNNKSLWDV